MSDKIWFFQHFTDEGGRKEPPRDPERDVREFLNKNRLSPENIKIVTWTDPWDGWQWFTVYYFAAQPLPADEFLSAMKFKR